MKSISTPLIWAFLFCLPLQLFAQKKLSGEDLVKEYSFYKNPDPTLNHLNYFEAMYATMQLAAASTMVLQEESTDAYGFTHFKFQQFHEGLPAFGNRYILHEKEGKVITATGHYSPRINASAKPGINAATALAHAKLAMKAQAYHAKETEPVLCWVDPAFPKVSETICLAYQVDLHSTEPFDKRRYFVEAASGRIIKYLPLILQEGVPSKAKTRYYGIQNIITDSIGPQQFVLRDPDRGDGITVYNGDEGNFLNTSSNWDLTNAQKDEVALDAHYCTQEYYDMMLDNHNWQGLDGQGQALIAYVHAGNFTNAFWDGEASYYGDGDCNYGPLTTLEVVGHEFTHGMIDFTSRLVYDNESGAINESLADMFGKMLERKSDPAHFSWDLGHSFILGAEGDPFRVMDDPNRLEMPAYYDGLYWQSGNNVHINSSIGNLWFSMLVDGKQGINEIGVPFDVAALGMEKAGELVFEVNKNYLTESSDYFSFYQYSFEVAGVLFGPGSVEELAVKEAWKAVGLPVNTTLENFDLSIVDEWLPAYNVCGLGAFMPVRFKIKNSGTIAYDPSTMGTVSLSTNQFSDYLLNLTNPIAPGEEVEVEVNDWLTASAFGFKSVFILLNFDDKNVDNNYANRYFNVFNTAPDELSLYAFIPPLKCFSATQTVNLYITNNSCETIPSGTALGFTGSDESGNMVWNSPAYMLTEDLPAAGSFFAYFDFPASNSPSTFTLIHPSDPDLSNNAFDDPTASNALPITANYLNNFETDSGQDQYLEMRIAPDGPTMLYQNSQFFASTGQYQSQDNFQRCADPLGVFTTSYAPGINASIRTCVDLSFSEMPVLEFDLAQFRNASTDTSGYQQSSMLQAKWTGNISGSQIIFDQPEGLVQHHNIALPPFFKGELEFKLYTELGHYWLNANYLDDDDFILLDNLKLSAPTVDAKEIAVSAAIHIAPNPALETVRIQCAEGLKTILLQNMSGQTLHTLQLNATTANLDLSNLVSGLYVLGIQLINGGWTFKKLVKID